LVLGDDFGVAVDHGLLTTRRASFAGFDDGRGKSCHRRPEHPGHLQAENRVDESVLDGGHRLQDLDIDLAEDALSWVGIGESERSPVPPNLLDTQPTCL